MCAQGAASLVNWESFSLLLRAAGLCRVRGWYVGAWEREHIICHVYRYQRITVCSHPPPCGRQQVSGWPAVATRPITHPSALSNAASQSLHVLIPSH